MSLVDSILVVAAGGGLTYALFEWPQIKRRIQWRLGWRDRELDQAFVHLKCPNSDDDEVFATENTPPVATERIDRGTFTTKSTYACDVCGSRHTFGWGPPAPILFDDDEEVEPDE